VLSGSKKLYFQSKIIFKAVKGLTTLKIKILSVLFQK
jgi:hypothetical protein